MASGEKASAVKPGGLNKDNFFLKYQKKNTIVGLAAA